MQGALREIGRRARDTDPVFDIRIKILIPHDDDRPPDTLSEVFAHRVDARVAEAQEEGSALFVTQRQYVVPVDVAVGLPMLEGGDSIGSRPAGSGGPGTPRVEAGEQVLGSQARARFQLLDEEEGKVYTIQGVRLLPRGEDAAIVVERET